MTGKIIGTRVEISGLEELFCPQGKMAAEDIQEVKLNDLYEFKDHPFRVEDDEEMEELTESIRDKGVLNPGIVRPRKGGGYEIISGHRRRRASELAGKDTMPVRICDYSDEEAVTVMVDSNIQREDVLPSEKAHAYKMKYEALKHQGDKKGGLTLEQMGEMEGKSGKTIQRYVWLSRLIDPLMTMVDKKTLGLSQAVELSSLSVTDQKKLAKWLSKTNLKITLERSKAVKRLSAKGELSEEAFEKLFIDKKSTRNNSIKLTRLSEYFSGDYSNDEIEKIIYALLEEWKIKKEK